jgi:hypothetical protein
VSEAKSPIKLDISTTGIVIWCQECDHWRAFRFLKEDAWDAACLHEELVHDEQRYQRDARDVRRHRARQTVERARNTPGILAM